MNVSSEFEADFAKAGTLYVLLDGKKIDQLSLAGTTVALSSLNTCLARLRTALAAKQREEARWADLPTDPFKAAVPQSVPNLPPVPLGPGMWVTGPAMRAVRVVR